MENDIYLCFFLIFFSGVSSQKVTITEDTVYIMNNVVGQVTCTLYGNCSTISWFVSKINTPIFSAFGFACKNTTAGYFQTCNDQNHQYTLYFTGTTSLHGETIRCSGENCTPQNTVSDTIAVFIIVPVPSVALEGISGQQITVTAGQSKSITCVTGASRPAPRVLWYIGVTNVTSLSTETQILSQEPDLFYTRSILTFIPTKLQNGLQLHCKAYNTENNLVELTTKPTLNVQYGPEPVILTPSINSYIVNETFQLGPITCSATCKPVCNYKWIRLNQDVIQGDTLMINGIQRRQTGTYKCQAYNTVGTRNSKGISVTVHYAARVTNMENSDGFNFAIPEHSTKTITCLAEGLPQPKITLAYISNSSIIKSVFGLRLDFTFPSARCEDTGIYKCDAMNKFTPQQPLQKTVFVLCRPRAAKELLQNRYALSVGKTLNITVSYLAYPRPTFKWFENIHNGSSIQIKDDQDDVQINDFAINTYIYVAQLIRRNLKEDDFGTYILTSSNVIGQNEDAYIVGAKGKPQKPRDGQAICIDYKSAFITWKPGFFNGYNQTFSVVYKEKGGTEQISVSNISDPGHDKYINQTVNSLQGAKTYFFTIYSRNTLGKSPQLEVNCSTGDAPYSGTSTGLAVGAGLGSAIVIIIIVVILIFVVKRFRRGLTKDGMRHDVLYEPAGPNFVRLGTSGGAIKGISSGATGGQNDYPDAELKKHEKSGLDNAVPVYAEVQKNPKEKKTDPSTVYADVQKPEKDNKGAKPKKMVKRGKAEKEKHGDLYENVENVNKGNFAAAAPTFVTKQNETKAAKPPKTPKRIKDGLIYVDLDLKEPVTKPGQQLIIRGLEDRTDYAEIDITRRDDPLPPDDKSPKDKKDSMA